VAARDDHAPDQPPRRPPGRRLLGASAFLAACGVEGTSNDEAPRSPGSGPARPRPGSSTSPTGRTTWTRPRSAARPSIPSLLAFTKETGIKVNYKEVIEENDAFLGKINPSLQAGQDPGLGPDRDHRRRPIEKLIRQNFLTELDHSKLPNFAKNAAPAVKNPGYDPGNKYTLAWQSGWSGWPTTPS
jgi:spermidine/putrescine transport system substrate-binding protein